MTAPRRRKIEPLPDSREKVVWCVACLRGRDWNIEWLVLKNDRNSRNEFAAFWLKAFGHMNHLPLPQ